LKENEAKRLESESKTLYKAFLKSTVIENKKEKAKKHIVTGLGYVMLYFLKANVTWQELGYVTSDKIGFKEMKTLIKDLCVKLPREYSKYLKYCRELNFEDGPCITDLEKLFKTIRKRRDFENDKQFDWFTKINKLPKQVNAIDTEEELKIYYKDKLKELLI
jgi:casein kinase I family protein HRR25